MSRNFGHNYVRLNGSNMNNNLNSDINKVKENKKKIVKGIINVIKSINSNTEMNKNLKKMAFNQYLISAVKYSLPRTVKYLLERGADPNTLDNKGENLLLMALYEDNNIAKLLIEYGADVNKGTKMGFTPLEFALIRRKNFDMASLLIDKGADINKGLFGFGLVSKASTLGDVNILKFLDKKKKINFNKALDRHGYAPIHSAAKSGKKNAVKFLIEKGVDINKPTKYGSTPLQLALSRGNMNMANFLIEHGANIHKKNKGFSIIHWAAFKGNKNIMEYLLDKGANINNVGRGLSPLAIALIKNKKNIVNLLEKRRAVYRAP